MPMHSGLFRSTGVAIWNRGGDKGARVKGSQTRAKKCDFQERHSSHAQEQGQDGGGELRPPEKRHDLCPASRPVYQHSARRC